MSTLSDIICENCGADSSHFIKNEGTWYCVKCSYPRRKPLFSNQPDPLNTDLDDTIIDDAPPPSSASRPAPSSPPSKKAAPSMSLFAGMDGVPSPGGATPAKPPRASPPRTPLAERSQNAADAFAQQPYPSLAASVDGGGVLKPRGSPTEASPTSQKDLSVATLKGSPLAESNAMSVSAIEQFCETPVIGINTVSVMGSDFTSAMAIPLDLDKSLTAKPSPFKPTSPEKAAPFSASQKMQPSASPQQSPPTPMADIENRENAAPSNTAIATPQRSRVSMPVQFEPATEIASPARTVTTHNPDSASPLRKSSPVTSSAAMVDKLTLASPASTRDTVSAAAATVAEGESAMEDDVDMVEESAHEDLPKSTSPPSIDSASLNASQSPVAAAADTAPLGTAVEEVRPTTDATTLVEPACSPPSVVQPIVGESEVTEPTVVGESEVLTSTAEQTKADTEIAPMQDTPASSPAKSPVGLQASAAVASNLDVPAFPALDVASIGASTPPAASVANEDSPMRDEDTTPVPSESAPTVSQVEPAQALASPDSIDDVISDHVSTSEGGSSPAVADAPDASKVASYSFDVAPAQSPSSSPFPSTPLGLPLKEKRVTASPPPPTSALRTPTHVTTTGDCMVRSTSASHTESEAAVMPVSGNPTSTVTPSKPTIAVPTESSFAADVVRTPVLATGSGTALASMPATTTTPVNTKAADDGDAMTDADFAEMLDEMRTPCASDRSTSDFSDSAGSLQSPPFAQPLFSPGSGSGSGLLSPPVRTSEKRPNPSRGDDDSGSGRQRFFPGVDGGAGRGNPAEKSRKLTEGASPRSGHRPQTLSQVPPPQHSAAAAAASAYDPREAAGILAVSQKLSETAAELHAERQKRLAQQEEMDTLRAKDEQRRAEQKDFVMKIRQLEREKNELYARVDSEAAEKASLERRIQSDAVVSRGKIEVLENENQRLREKERLHRNMHEERQKECRTLRSQLDDVQAKHNDLLATHARMTRQHEELQARFEALKTQASAQLAEGGKLYQMARDSLKTTQLQLKEKSSTLDAVNLELANAKSELDSQTKLKANYMQRADALSKSLAAKEKLEAAIKAKYAAHKANFEAQQHKANDALLLKEQFMNELIEKKEENASLREQIMKLQETQGEQAEAQQQLQHFKLEQSSLKTRLFDLNEKYEKTKTENGELLQYVDQLLKQQGK